MTQRFAFLLAAILIVAMAMISTASAFSLGSSPDREIHSSGTGNVIGSPDRAQISLAIETENADVKVAQQDNTVQMNRMIDALVAAGIPREGLKTTGYNIFSVYNGDTKSPQGQKIRSYRVINTLTVTLHNVSRTGEVIDVAVANGVNQASSIQFMLSDEQAQVLRTEALKKAVVRARADADTVSSSLGVQISGIKSVDISGGYMPVLYENYQIGGAVPKAAPTPIQPGDLTVTATVSITFLIR